jgi:hypothetical protein
MTTMNLFVKATTSNSVITYQAFTINVPICVVTSITKAQITALTINADSGTIKSSEAMDSIFTA